MRPKGVTKGVVCRFERAPAGTNRLRRRDRPTLASFTSPATSGVLFCRAARHATIKTRRPPIGGRPALFGCSNQTSTTATILWLRSTMMISSPTTKYMCPRHWGWISMSAGGTSTTRTLVGTVVPTRTEKLTLLTRGTFPPAKTVCRICVRCCVVRFTLPPAWPCWVWPCCACPCCGAWLG